MKAQELLGIEDVAAALSITPGAASQRLRRGTLPPPDHVVSGRPIWIARSFHRWVAAERKAGRL